MGGESWEVLSALDKAKTQWYHFTAIVIAGMGFFTDAYDLFCITCVTKLLGRIYFPDGNHAKPGTLPTQINNWVTGVALVGTFVGQLFFGLLGDKLGRKRVYGITLIIMVVSALCSGLSFGRGGLGVMRTLCFFRFWLGFGIGGDYPLSATIMSEYANKKTRGGFIAAVFAMQGVGIITAGLVSMTVSACFRRAFPVPVPPPDLHNAFVVRGADCVWRIILMLGALPALLTYYWRMKMPETARFTALVKGNAKQAAADMSKVLDVPVQPQAQPHPQPAKQGAPYTMFSREFLRKHGAHLLGTATTWLLLDVAFYTNNLTQKDVFTVTGLLPKPERMDALEEVFRISRAQFLVALFATFPGYWFTVFLIDSVGRFRIQLAGFFMMSIFMFTLAIRYHVLKAHYVPLFVVLYALTFFFANFGPNSTTFVVPAELFPARFRSTCHGISAASGKAGAIFAAFAFQQKTPTDGRTAKILMYLAVVNALGFFFTFLVPETKGRSLEEISGEDSDVEHTSRTAPNEIEI